MLISAYHNTKKIANLLSLCYYNSKENLLQYVERRFQRKDILSMGTLDDKRNLIGIYFADIVPYIHGNIVQNGECCIHPDHQKKGIGSRLFDAIIEEAVKNRGVTHHEAKLLKPFRLKEFLEGKGYGEIEHFKLMGKWYEKK